MNRHFACLLRGAGGPAGVVQRRRVSLSPSVFRTAEGPFISRCPSREEFRVPPVCAEVFSAVSLIAAVKSVQSRPVGPVRGSVNPNPASIRCCHLHHAGRGRGRGRTGGLFMCLSRAAPELLLSLLAASPHTLVAGASCLFVCLSNRPPVASARSQLVAC